MGGKSSSKGSDAMIREQRAQADEARAKEFARQQRIDQGLAGIKNAFEGSSKTAQRGANFDWSSLIPNTAAGRASATAKGPSGFSFVNVGGSGGGGGGGGADPLQATFGPNPISAALFGGSRYQAGGRDAGQISYVNGASRNSAPQAYQYGVPVTVTQGASRNSSPRITPLPVSQGGPGGAGGWGGTGGGAEDWAVRGPDGRIYRRGESIPYQETYETGERQGGFGQDFYDKFRNSILNYYNPQVAQQYGEAKDKLTYDLARAGTGRSSMSTAETAKLAEQNRLNKADVVTKADTGAADLRSRVANERAKAEGQLYATENPDVATNQALAAVRNLSLEQPNLNPLGEIFKTALVGGANALGGYRNQQTLNSIPGYNPRGSSRTVPG